MVAITEDFAVIKFGSTDRNLNSVGYTGTNDRVAAALNHIFAPEIAISGLGTQISSLFSVTGHEGSSNAAKASGAGTSVARGH